MHQAIIIIISIVTRDNKLFVIVIMIWLINNINKQKTSHDALALAADVGKVMFVIKFNFWVILKKLPKLTAVQHSFSERFHRNAPLYRMSNFLVFDSQVGMTSIRLFLDIVWRLCNKGLPQNVRVYTMSLITYTMVIYHNWNDTMSLKEKDMKF